MGLPWKNLGRHKTMQIDVLQGALLRVAGQKDAPTIIFLPAFGDSGHCYRDVFATDLAERYRLISVDLWGFGASPTRADIRTFKEFCIALEKLVNTLSMEKPVGLVGHSIAGSMAVEVAYGLNKSVTGVFSIEGNLTPDDAMFTGRASKFDNPEAFKKSFLEDIWKLGHDEDALRHYYSGARMGDATTMWHLGRDVGQVSVGNHLGNRLLNLGVPNFYYWSKKSTPKATQDWIANHDIANETYEDAGHWPMVEQPIATAARIGRFFDSLPS